MNQTTQDLKSRVFNIQKNTEEKRNKTTTINANKNANKKGARI